MSDTRDRMQEVANAVAAILPPGTGFVVLGFDHQKPGQNVSTGRLDYVSNSARPDICRAMIEFIAKSAQGFNEHEKERLLSVQVEIDEGQRQTILLALAELALRRPGWNETLTETASRFDGVEIFEKFKVTSAGRLP